MTIIYPNDGTLPRQDCKDDQDDFFFCTRPNTKLPIDEEERLLALPAEIILHISSYLPYPDLLSMRHTHPLFFRSPLIDTSKKIIKIQWLISRGDRGLPIPRDNSLLLSSDEAFCQHREVKEIMRRRLDHGECKPGVIGGCEIITGNTCEGSRSQKQNRAYRGWVQSRMDDLNQAGWLKATAVTVWVILMSFLLIVQSRSVSQQIASLVVYGTTIWWFAQWSRVVLVGTGMCAGLYFVNLLEDWGWAMGMNTRAS